MLSKFYSDLGVVLHRNNLIISFTGTCSQVHESKFTVTHFPFTWTTEEDGASRLSESDNDSALVLDTISVTLTMKRLVFVLAFVSSTIFVINGENSTGSPQTGPASLGEESALEKGAKPLFNLVHGFLDSVQEYDFITDNSSAKISKWIRIFLNTKGGFVVISLVIWYFGARLVYSIASNIYTS